MKKLLFALIVLSTASILADKPLVLSPRHTQETGPITIDGLVYSQTYNFGRIDAGASITEEGDNWFCDDSDPDTNLDVWTESAPCNNTFTGDSNRECSSSVTRGG